jgi:hypothetical protein
MNITTHRRIVSIMSLALIVTTLPAMAAPNATVTTNVIADSSIQYSATLGTSFTNYVSGYNKVKNSLTAPCKSYFKFDFTGQNPNTNYALKITLPAVINNGYEHLLVWVLNQEYPSFTTNKPGLTWFGAQANNTATNNPSSDMLTSGNPSATLVNDGTDPGGNTVDTWVTVPAPWGQYLTNNQVVIVLTVTNDVTTGTTANGGRFTLAGSATPPYATFQPLTSGTQPPTISAIAKQTVRSTTTSDAIAFTVSDPLDAASSLTNITILLGNTNVSFTSTNIAVSGGNRTLTFTPVSNLAPGTTANVTVTLIVTDSSGNSATSSFQLTVSPFITLPVVLSGTNVNYIPPTNRVGIGSITIPFQVVDTNITASQLVVTGSVSAYTANLGALSFTQTAAGSNTNDCTVTVTATGSGVGIVNLQAIDTVNSVTNTVRLAVMVLPDSSYAVYDLMSYQPSTSYSSPSGHADLLDVSARLWAARSISGSVNLITSLTPSSGGIVPVGLPLIRGSASGNANELRLVGAPYTAGSHKVLYASINAQWADLSLYGEAARYPGQSVGGFVEFAADANATGVAMAAVCTITNSANTTNNDGLFGLALYNGTNTAPVAYPGFTDIIPNYNTSGVIPNSTPNNVVVSYDVDTGISMLWVNQSSSAGTSVSLQDVAATNLVNCSYIVLRQNANMGDLLISSVAVKVVTKPVPTITGITRSEGTNSISFTCAPGSGGTASVVGSSTVNGTYNAISPAAAITEPTSGNFVATFSDSGSQMFYRIKQTALASTVTFPF